MPTSYDEILYIGAPFAQTHPDRLAMLAHLFGMKPAPVERCRVLELGCTDGGNLIPMALALPGSEFVGIDLSERAVAAGLKIIGDLNLTNIELRAGDIMDVDAGWGKFDFIITHGLFSWAPAPVRDRILRISKQNLAPQGVAYVSYNAHPGSHLRTMIRDMMLFHLRDVLEPAERIARARELIAFLAAHMPDGAGDHRGFLRKEFEDILERDPNALFHDELGEVWEPVFFHQFMSQAGAHGLQFLAEANYSDMQDKAFGDGAAETLQSWGTDRLVREQYRDFLKCRRFRQTLLCHQAIQLDAEPSSAAIETLYASSPATLTSVEDGVKTFEGVRGSSLKTAHPVAISVVERLIDSWPRALHFDELAAHVGSEHRGAQADILLALCSAGLVQLHVWRAEFAAVPCQYPVASPLARLQAEAGSWLTTLRHTSIEAKGALERRLIALLDGTRDRAALERALRPLSPETAEDVFREEVENNLVKAAYLALLTKPANTY
jgi:methyltransferase-like protein/SAM-dependent methyltransferase